MKIYIATAYRWGWINNGSYNVVITTKRHIAVSMAEGEAAGRGGKYGVEVRECEDGGSTEGVVVGEVIAYFPSAYGEKAASMNYRITLFEMVGNRIVPERENGNTVDVDKVIADVRQMLSIFEKVEKTDAEPAQ